MHFVKKETISSTEKTAEEKKRAAKSQAFIQTRDKIFEKRKNGNNSQYIIFEFHLNSIQDEYDEEIMELTGELLTKNPDIYTLWNIRREAIEHFVKVFIMKNRKSLYLNDF
jgi:uncharacterized membrane protein YkoI